MIESGKSKRSGDEVGTFSWPDPKSHFKKLITDTFSIKRLELCFSGHQMHFPSFTLTKESDVRGPEKRIFKRLIENVSYIEDS